MNCSFEPDGCHRRTYAVRWVVAILAPPGAAALAATRAVLVAGTVGPSGPAGAAVPAEASVTTLYERVSGRFGGGGDSSFDAPSANTWSFVAVPPLDDVGVPPELIATYCRPATAKIVGPAAIWLPVWNDQRIRPFRRSKARSIPSPPPAKPSPEAVVVTPPRSGCGVLVFHTRRPVLTSIALIDPWSFQPGRYEPNSPFARPRKTSPSRLRFFCVGVRRS